MKYQISSLNVNYNQETISTSCMGAPVNSPGQLRMTVSLEAEVSEYQQHEIEDLDAFQDAFKNSGSDEYLASLDLPPLRKLLEMHYPEKLL